MYPGTVINPWIDNTIETEDTTTTVDNSTLFLTASSFDKGPEEMTRVTGSNFYNLFGTGNLYKNHGQAAIQAARIIDAGGELLVKRIVADDATLANIVFLAQLTTDTTASAASDSEVTAATKTTLKITASYIENCYSFEDVKTAALKLYDTENKVFPLIIVADNGRGKSSKAVCFSRSSEISQAMGKQFFTVAVYEGTTRTDSVTATIDSTVYGNTQYGLEEDTATQVKFYVDSDIFDEYRSEIAEALGLDEDTVSKYDLINMLTIKGASLDGVTVDAESIDMGVTYGIALQGGSNGEFGDAPKDTTAWEEALNDFFGGEYDNAIYDLDEYHIGAVVDACYPYSVKETIAQLVSFRKDCVYFRDFCLDADSYGTTVEVLNKFTTNNNFIANYMTWYQIYDPDTKKRIPVTMMYDFAACLVAAFDNGIYNPEAGIANGFILESAIDGTICYTPRITPTMNQKQMMDDLKVNYAVFQSGDCVVQSLYTAQEAYSQLSYVNNTLAIQEVIRAVRTACPKNRYTFIDNADFSTYADAVEEVLREFKSNFDTLVFQYTQDSIMSHHKIFYASIKFAFKDWAQTELFDIYIIDNTETVASESSEE
jgi:hypothetical protein